MSVTEWLKENRLKVISMMAVTADFLMGLAGGVNLFFPERVNHLSDLCLVIASAIALAGHAGLLIWGKGGRLKEVAGSGSINEAVIYIRPFMPWKYPLDWAFLNFILAGGFFVAAGMTSANIPLALKGGLIMAASTLGWIWPQNRRIGSLQPLQITVVLYACASINTFLAGLVAENGFMIAAGFFYIGMNMLLYTVRKENQSRFTQTKT